MQKLPVPNVVLNTQDQGSVFQGKMNALSDACKTSIQAYNNQIDAAATAQQFSEAAQQALMDTDVTPVLQRLNMVTKAAAVLDLDFTRGDYTVYESAELAFQKKQLAEVLTTTRGTAAQVNTPFGLRSVGVDVPRIEFDPESGECLGLLCEEQRTNLATNSEVITASTGTTLVSSNSVIAPDGNMTADIIGETVTTGEHYAGDRGITMTAGQVYTWSCYVKRISGSTSRFYLRVATNAIKALSFNIDSGADFASAEGGMESLPNGWRRCWVVTPPATTTGNAVCRMQFVTSSGSGSVYEGDTNEQFSFWGTQLELGSYPTSYIPTAASAVTRSNESNIIPLPLTLSKFTYIAEVIGARMTTSNRLLSAGGAGNNRIELLQSGLVTQVSGGTINTININPPLTTARFRIAIRFDAGTVSLFINGVKIGYAETGSFIFAIADIKINSNSAASMNTSATLNAFKFIPRSLSDAELQELTRL